MLVHILASSKLVSGSRPQEVHGLGQRAVTVAHATGGTEVHISERLLLDEPSFLKQLLLNALNALSFRGEVPLPRPLKLFRLPVLPEEAHRQHIESVDIQHTLALSSRLVEVAHLIDVLRHVKTPAAVAALAETV